MIPIENTLAGSVVEHYDLLREHSVFIERESVIRIEHNVIGIPNSTLDQVQRVYSHPVALAQCRSFFQQHPGIEPIAFYDTAGAVKQIIQLQDRHSAAIAGIQAAEIYGGVVLAAGVEDDAANFTRFLLVKEGTASSSPEGAHKLSLCCRVDHRPGSLAVLLTEVAAAGGNLTQVQSRPVHGRPWKYHVFLDALMPGCGGNGRVAGAAAGAGHQLQGAGALPGGPRVRLKLGSWRLRHGNDVRYALVTHRCASGSHKNQAGRGFRR